MILNRHVDIPPPCDFAAGHSILSHQPPAAKGTGSPENVPVREGQKITNLNRQKKRVILIDPKTELTDDEFLL